MPPSTRCRERSWGLEEQLEQLLGLREDHLDSTRLHVVGAHDGSVSAEASFKQVWGCSTGLVKLYRREVELGGSKVPLLLASRRACNPLKLKEAGLGYRAHACRRQGAAEEVRAPVRRQVSCGPAAGPTK